ncbi:UbiA prenyltransferase family protein [Flavobacteriaceae bacterium]|nr:UbiA prenyltransferase family protein [Flavobacteriaceae bacterium]
MFNSIKLINTFYVILSFSLVASFIYIINDIFDIEFDKIHPEKRNRPIASGKISIKQSLSLGFCFLSLGLIVLWNVSYNSFLLTILYVILNFCYSLKLKHIPIVDFIIIALGFVIRILIGGEIGNIELTQWMIVMIFLLSLFIAITKRRDDVYQFELEKKINRKVVSEYTVEYMDKLITITSSALLVSYLLFITSESVISRYPSKYLIVSFLFVLVGVFRYNLITYVKNKSGSPLKILFKDFFLQITLLLWVLTFFIIIYTSKL